MVLIFSGLMAVLCFILEDNNDKFPQFCQSINRGLYSLTRAVAVLTQPPCPAREPLLHCGDEPW